MMRCIRGQHSKGATNWIMTHEGQIWARDLDSKVTPGSRSVLHSRLIILSPQSGTPALTAPHIHAHTHINMYTACIVCAESLCPPHQQAQVALMDWIKRLKINASRPPLAPAQLFLTQRKHGLWVPSPLHSLTFHLSTHLQLSHPVFSVPIHWSAGDASNISEQPNLV